MYSLRRIIYKNIEWKIVPSQKGWQYLLKMGDNLLNETKIIVVQDWIVN